MESKEYIHTYILNEFNKNLEYLTTQIPDKQYNRIKSITKNLLNGIKERKDVSKSDLLTIAKSIYNEFPNYKNYKDTNNIIDIDLIDRMLHVCLTSFKKMKLQVDKNFVNFWIHLRYKYYLEKMYILISEHSIRTFILGITSLYFYRLPTVDYYLFGERHDSHIINIPAYGIHIYKVFESIIEQNIKNNKKVHIFLECSGITLFKKIATLDINYIKQVFLDDSCSIFYYIGIIRRYLILEKQSELENLKKNIDWNDYFKKFNDIYKQNYPYQYSIFISNFNLCDNIEFHITDFRNLYDNIVNKLKENGHNINVLTHKYEDNWLIFPDKLKEIDKTIDIPIYMEIIMNPMQTNTVYGDLHNELNNAGVMTTELIDIINKTFNDNDESTISHIMDHITILKLLHLHYTKEQSKLAILFYGGEIHTSSYSHFISLYMRDIVSSFKKKDTVDNGLYLPLTLNDIYNIKHDFSISTFDSVSYKDKIEMYPIKELNNYMYYYDNGSLPDLIKLNTNSAKFLNADYLVGCRSQYNCREETKGGTDEFTLVQPIQMLEVQRKKLTTLEQAELVELRFLFKDVDILASVEQVLELAILYNKQEPIDLTGGSLFRNKWLQFLLG